MNEYEFQTKYSESDTDEQRERCVAILQGAFHSEHVYRASERQDRSGADYVVEMDENVSIFIDHKMRWSGCSRFWYGVPELSLELWSVCPSGVISGTPGWTWDEKKITDYVLFTVDESDSDEYYILPFHLLRMVFRKNYREWDKQYPSARQQSNCGRWQSECIFVPVDVVVRAIYSVMMGHWT